MEAFEVDRLYLFTAYSLLKHSERFYESYGRLDYNIVVLDTYRELVNGLRKKDSFYNSYIVFDNNVYTIDDLFKEYDELLKKVEGK